MSLIYDALRKSEQQRRLGETPTLSTPPSWTPRRRHPQRAVAVAALVVALAAGAWWVGRASLRETPVPVVAGARIAPPVAAPRDPAPSVPTAPATPTAPAAESTTPPGSPVGGASAPIAATITPTPATDAPAPIATDAPPAGAPDPAISPESDRQTDTAEAFANSPAQRVPSAPTAGQAYVPPDAALPEPLPDLENVPVAAAPPVATPPPPAPVTTDPNAIATVVAPTRPATDAPAPAPPAVSTLAEDAAAAAATVPVAPANGATPVPYVFELPLATRRELPPLKLNMHVYSSDPAQRFVIVDGTRAAEGGNVAADLDVAEIRNDGVVLTFRGSRFLLPRSGG